MFHLHLHNDQLLDLRQSLRQAGDHEIGGVLVGEHLGESQFRLCDLSIQESVGNEVCFVRLPEEHADFIAAFHHRTQMDYARFNYLGEWHSHPLFEAYPSNKDIATMQGIVNDPSEVAQFAVLLIVRLDRCGMLQINGSVFQAYAPPEPIKVIVEGLPKNKLRQLWAALTTRRRVPSKKTANRSGR